MAKKIPFLNKLLIIILNLVRPLLGRVSCSFFLTCGNFACEELAQKNLIVAIWSIIKRLCACTFFFKNYSN